MKNTTIKYNEKNKSWVVKINPDSKDYLTPTGRCSEVEINNKQGEYKVEHNLVLNYPIAGDGIVINLNGKEEVIFVDDDTYII